ncbi:hypothetical protein DITRI_Ditri09bG0039500 [Diplodiscus trichospermus]
MSGRTVENKPTKEKSRDQPVVPVSSTTTNNGENASSTPKFSEELKIEENGTAPVKLATGLTVAIKTLNIDGLQGHKEWLAEVDFLGNLLHPNLVKLVGYCIEDNHRLLVYEFMSRGSLENDLFRSIYAYVANNMLRTRPRMIVVVETLKPLQNLKDMASSSYYSQTIQSDRFRSSNFNAKNGIRTHGGFVVRNGQPVRSLYTSNDPQASPHHNPHPSPKPKAKEL